MSEYIVTARKYRPGLFTEVIGQEHITNTLENAIKTNRIAHAYLFTGTRGVGKTTTARIFAKALNCEKGPTTEPCNVCKYCKQITDGNSLDVLEIDGATNTGVDDIRSLKENINYTPSPGKYKIYIIDEVHMLSTSAFNALLKTLEEPPPKVVFIFATTEPHKIPITILSRCQRYDFKRIPREKIVSQLEKIAQLENIQITPAGLNLIAQKSGGSMRDAESLFDQVVSFCGSEVQFSEIEKLLGITGSDVYFRIFEAIKEHDIYQGLIILNKLLYTGVDVPEFLNGFLEFIRNLIVIKLNPNPDDIFGIPKDDFKRLQEIAQQFAILDIYRLMNIIAKYENMAKFSGRTVVILEMMLFKIFNLGSVNNIEEIILKIKDMGINEVPRQKPESAPKIEQAPKEKDYEAIWKQLVSNLMKTHPRIGINLKETRVIEIKDQTVLIKVHYATEVIKKFIEQPENLKEISNEYSKLLDEQVDVKFKYEIIDKAEIKKKIEDSFVNDLPVKDKTIVDYKKDYPIIDYILTQFNAIPYTKKEYRREHKQYE